MLNAFAPFSIPVCPAPSERALIAIKTAVERVERFPELGRPTGDPELRQIVVPFGTAGYIVRYSVMPDDKSILVVRVWHGRETRD